MTTPADPHVELPRHVDATTARWLVGAMAPEREPQTWRDGASAPADLLPAALVHGVEGWVFERARECGHEVDGLASAVHAAVARHQRALADLRVVRRTLDDAGVPFLVVKGPAVARRYAAPSLRSYVDLDIVVDPAEVESALLALEGSGCRLLDRNWPMLERAAVHELTLLTPGGGPLDLHWSLGPSPLTTDRSPSVAALLERSVPVDLGGLATRGLEPADELVHLAVHAAASGGHRLAWLGDLREVLADDGLDPSGVARRAREWGALPAVGIMLARLERLLAAGEARGGAPVRVGSRGWRLVDAAVVRVSPPQRTGTGPSLSRIVARSSRRTVAGSLLALATKTSARARGTVSGEEGVDVWDVTDPRSARHPHGGDEGRREFLSWVRRSRS